MDDYFSCVFCSIYHYFCVQHGHGAVIVWPFRVLTDTSSIPAMGIKMMLTSMSNYRAGSIDQDAISTINLIPLSIGGKNARKPTISEAIAPFYSSHTDNLFPSDAFFPLLLYCFLSLLLLIVLVFLRG